MLSLWPWAWWGGIWLDATEILGGGACIGGVWWVCPVFFPCSCVVAQFGVTSVASLCGCRFAHTTLLICAAAPTSACCPMVWMVLCVGRHVASHPPLSLSLPSPRCVAPRAVNNGQWKCDGCETQTQAHKQQKVWKLPHILIVLLKRYIFKSDERRRNSRKVRAFVTVELVLLCSSCRLILPYISMRRSALLYSPWRHYACNTTSVAFAWVLDR